MLHRRDAMLRLGTAACGALSLPRLLQSERAAAAESVLARNPSARACIFLFMWGGQPQQDMWDLKPEAPTGIRSPFSQIDTAVPGISLGDQMPQIARQTDKLAIIRSLQHTATSHDVSVFHALTGRAMLPPRTFPTNGRRRTDFPGIGSMFSYMSPKGAVPASFSIPRTVAHDGVRYAGTHAGILGAKHDPVELGQVFNHVDLTAHRDSNQADIPLTLPDDVSAARLLARRGLLRTLEDQDRALQQAGPLQNERLKTYGEVYEDAYRMLSAPAVKTALDLEREPVTRRERYGRNEYGESFLTARRLIEAGVRLVTVNWMFITPQSKVYNVWDAHGGLNDLEQGATGYGMLKAHYCLPAFDQAFSALLEDLSQSGLLSETIVACVGEFGRTPQINGVNGRDHWPFCYSGVLAGGGVRGGTVYGASDKHAAYVKENPATPGDYLATICHACGIDPAHEIHDLEGRPFRLCDGEPIEAVLK